MIRASKTISLFLVGTATALAGYEAVAPHDRDDYYGSTTQPSGYHGTGYSHSYSGRSFFSSHYGSYGSSASHSGTSRGGFGSSGHAAGS